jgi:hypothetical protein
MSVKNVQFLSFRPLPNGKYTIPQPRSLLELPEGINSIFYSIRRALSPPPSYSAHSNQLMRVTPTLKSIKRIDKRKTPITGHAKRIFHSKTPAKYRFVVR